MAVSSEKTFGSVWFDRLVCFCVMALLGVLILYLYSDVVPPERVNQAKTTATLHSLRVALDMYRVQYHAYPPDCGVGLHADLDKPSECLVYYLSGASIRYTPGVSSQSYPWQHVVYDTRRAGQGREARSVVYPFSNDMLVDTDGDGIPEVTDAWGQLLLYNSGPAGDGPFNRLGAPRHDDVDLLSAGPDGEFGTDDDVVNWTDGLPNGYGSAVTSNR